jgi:NADPH:quinone reductase-like Zn-dependent oxidoreductase
VFFARNANLQGIEVGSRKMVEDMNAFIEQHQIKPVIDRVFEFSDVKESLRYLESGARFGKIVVKI